MNVTGIAAYCLFLLITGYVLPGRASLRISRIVGWTLAAATVCLSGVLANDAPPVVRMAIIVFMQLLSMKLLVSIESYPLGNRLSPAQWVAFALGWFGMNPKLFERLPGPALFSRGLAFKGLSRIVAAVIMLFISFAAGKYSFLAMLFVPQLLLLTAISLILHFGLLNLSASWWRLLGADVPELFRAPYRSRSLKEFWGRRWNLAFSEMTALILYRPLKSKVGGQAAMMLSFLLSGALHEIAISLPVRSGYGLSMLYFAIHAVAMNLESRPAFARALNQSRGFAFVWVFGMLIIPLPLLFHHQFITHVLEPIREQVLRLFGG
ncbi:membrane bound O-acyl transferase family-domain-containing protein [Chryseolinea sp. T2]|uniref:wax synthase family protein n=1 Tax=Chryseolinea sp. T2 TaxID=3129255 RepID=UPI003077712B